MNVAAGGGEGGVTKCGLYNVNFGVSIEGMAGVGVAEPVWGDLLPNSGSFGGAADDSHCLDAAEVAAFAAAEDRIVVTGGSTKGHKGIPYCPGKQHSPGLAAFAVGSHLSTVCSWLEVSPFQATDFRHPQPGSVRQ